MLIRWALTPVLGNNLPYFLTFIAILLAARWFGSGPGLFAMAIGSLPPIYNVVFHSRPLPPSAARFWLTLGATYVVVSLLVWLIDRHRGMGMQVETTTRLADQRLEQLSVA